MYFLVLANDTNLQARNRLRECIAGESEILCAIAVNSIQKLTNAPDIVRVQLCMWLHRISSPTCNRYYKWISCEKRNFPFLFAATQQQANFVSSSHLTSFSFYFCFYLALFVCTLCVATNVRFRFNCDTATAHRIQRYIGPRKLGGPRHVFLCSTATWQQQYLIIQYVIM